MDFKNGQGPRAKKEGRWRGRGGEWESHAFARRGDFPHYTREIGEWEKIFNSIN